MSGSFAETGEEGGGSLRFRQVDDIVEELNLRQGELIHAYVEKYLPGDEQRLLLNLKGRDVVAASRPEVNPGDSLVVRVTSVSDPVELEIFTPEEAGDELSHDQLDGLVSSLGLQPTEKLSRLTGAALEQGMPLDGDLLSDAARHLGKLTDAGGSVIPGRLRAFQFLYSHDQQVNKGLLKNLEHLPADSGEIDWSPALTRTAGDKGGRSFDLGELLAGLGIDLVARIGRKPFSASKTVHARLLKKVATGRAGPGDSQLLSTLLAMAIANIKKNDVFNLQLPLLEGKGLGQLRLYIKIGSTPEGWREPDWSARLVRPGANSERLGVEVKKRKHELKFYFRCLDREKLTDLRGRIDQFEHLFTEAGYEVSCNFVHAEPLEIPDPLATSSAGSDSSVSGGVDLQA